MTLPELINYFREGGSFEKFCETQRLDADAEAIEIYTQKPFGINSKMEFFAVEETAGNIVFNYNGSEFHNLFDFYYFLDVVEESKTERLQHLTNIDLALRLLNYIEKDA